MGGLRHRALSVETEDPAGRSGPHSPSSVASGDRRCGPSPFAHAAVAHEIDIRVVVVGRPMALKVVEKCWPIERQPMCLEVPHRERECMIDPDQCRLRLQQASRPAIRRYHAASSICAGWVAATLRAAATPGPPCGRAAPSGWRSASAPPSSRCRRSGRRLARVSRSRPTTTRWQPGEPRGARPRAGGPCRPRRGSPPAAAEAHQPTCPGWTGSAPRVGFSVHAPGPSLSTSTLARGSTSTRPRSNGHGPRLSLVRPWTGGPATRSTGGHRRR